MWSFRVLFLAAAQSNNLSPNEVLHCDTECKNSADIANAACEQMPGTLVCADLLDSYYDCLHGCIAKASKLRNIAKYE
ncbi:unnamed protein product [Dicrocoelium dendriticum]|nr:unnamed protein product [Dicrocoelium dendriticum]